MSELRVKAGDREFVRHTLVEMRHTNESRPGDMKVMWNPRDADEVQAARKSFERLIRKGFKAYRVDEGGEAVPPALTEFDPSIEKIVMAPQLQGG